MRVAHVTATYPPRSTGTGNVAHHNALELVRRGHDVHVFTIAGRDTLLRERRDGIEIHRLEPWFQTGNAALAPALFRSLSTFDLVHLHMPFYGGCEAVYALKRLRNKPLVITHHQDVILSGPAGLVSAFHDRFIGRALMRAADRVFFTSLDYGRASRFADLLAGRRLQAVELPNGVDPQRFAPGPPSEDLVRRHGLAGKDVVLFVGALDRAHYFKGVPVLLRALARIRRPDLAVIVVGGGDMRSIYEAEARTLGLTGQVRFAGFVQDEDLPDYYRLADVTVLPSTTMGEAFGLVLLESLATATPVIASCLPGVRTIVAHEQDGYLVPPGDVEALAGTLSELLSMPPARRRALGLAGRSKVENRYAWRRSGDRLECLYEDLFARHADQTAGAAAEVGT